MIRKILFQVKNEKNYCFSLLENLFHALGVCTDMESLPPEPENKK